MYNKPTVGLTRQHTRKLQKASLREFCAVALSIFVSDFARLWHLHVTNITCGRTDIYVPLWLSYWQAPNPLDSNKLWKHNYCMTTKIHNWVFTILSITEYNCLHRQRHWRPDGKHLSFHGCTLPYCALFVSTPLCNLVKTRFWNKLSRVKIHQFGQLGSETGSKLCNFSEWTYISWMNYNVLIRLPFQCMGLNIWVNLPNIEWYITWHIHPYSGDQFHCPRGNTWWSHILPVLEMIPLSWVYLSKYSATRHHSWHLKINRIQFWQLQTRLDRIHS